MNIVSTDFFKYSFIDHVIFMGPVAVVTILSSLLIVYMFFRKMIPKKYSARRCLGEWENYRSFSVESKPHTPGGIDVGYVLASLHRIPVSIVICSGALILMAAYTLSLKMKWGMALKDERRGITAIIKEINWDIVISMISIFLVVHGLKHTGAVDFSSTLSPEL